jgi:hypothetical protein
VATSIAAPAAPSGSALSVSASHARPFEPTGLGPFYPLFAAFLQKIANRRQTETLRLIAEERAARREDTSTDSLAYQLALSVLADYIAFGNYPIVANGRCFLVSVLESEEIDPGRRRILAKRLFCLARDRALADRNQLRWIEATVAALEDERYQAAPVIDAIRSAAPEFRLLEARSSAKALDARGLWRAVRTTWSMGVESSAPGREVAFVGVDDRYPSVPLGIVQFRNVVPEIVSRDRWLGVTSTVAVDGRPLGYLRYLADADARDRLSGTRKVLANLLANINPDGLRLPLTSASDPRPLIDLATSQRVLFNDLRRQGKAGAQASLMVVKRAETGADLIRGLSAIDAALASLYPLKAFTDSVELVRNLNAGLRKIWHYHMGFVAMEMSICGAAPPFGPMRLGKLMASVAASEDVITAWGSERPLGEIAASTYLPSVREAVPNPGPLVVFTSGLYPGHSAQYNRLQVGSSRWSKIGETVGYGSFHVSVDTSRLASEYNAAVDGYRHITRSFGEGASPRFREVDRAIRRLELPDLLRHEMARPLYALPLVASPQASLLGWGASEDTPSISQPLSALARAWWERWVAPRSGYMSHLATETPDLRAELTGILGSASADL